MSAPETNAAAAQHAPPKAVRDPRQYRAALQTWLRAQRPARQNLRVTAVDMPRATGFSNETVFFEAAWEEAGAQQQRRYVARIEPEAGALFPAQNAACEISVAMQYRLMQCVANSGAAPVPPLLAYEKDAAVLGRPFFVMEFVPGEIPADVPRYSTHGFLADEATPQERRRMVESGLQCMAALHKLNWRAAGLHWLKRGGGDEDGGENAEPEFAQQLRLYQNAVQNWLAGREHPVLLRALDWLQQNAPRPAPPAALSWGDARLGNIIWQNYRPAAVLDWEAAALQPPQADLGWWLMFDRMSFDDMQAPRLQGFPARDEMVRCWEAASGLPAGDTHYWEVFAIVRFCAIFIGLGDRMVRAGHAPAAQNPAIQNGVTDALAKRLGVGQSGAGGG